jgi:hypothetical protein
MEKNSMFHRPLLLALGILGPALALSLLAGCALPQGSNPLLPDDEVGVPNMNPAAQGPMYYRYIPSAAHDIVLNGVPEFPGPNPAQNDAMLFSLHAPSNLVLRGLRRFVNYFYAGGFPEVQQNVQDCYAKSNYYLYRNIYSKSTIVMPRLAEDDTAYLYNTLLHENWGLPLYPYFTVVPFARRNLTELRLANQNLEQSKRIMDIVSDDLQIALPTEIEYPVAEDRPGS